MRSCHRPCASPSRLARIEGGQFDPRLEGLTDGAVCGFDFRFHLSDGGERRALAGVGDSLQQRFEAWHESVLHLDEAGLTDGLSTVGHDFEITEHSGEDAEQGAGLRLIEGDDGVGRATGLVRHSSRSPS